MRAFHLICQILSGSAELKKSMSNSSPHTQEMKLLLGVDSWSSLGKIINDITRKFEDYDLDEIAVAHLMLVITLEKYESIPS